MLYGVSAKYCRHVLNDFDCRGVSEPVDWPIVLESLNIDSFTITNDPYLIRISAMRELLNMHGCLPWYGWGQLNCPQPLVIISRGFQWGYMNNLRH